MNRTPRSANRRAVKQLFAKDGFDESALAKFANGKRGLSLKNLDRLCEYLGLRIVMDRKPKKGR